MNFILLLFNNYSVNYLLSIGVGFNYNPSPPPRPTPDFLAGDLLPTVVVALVVALLRPAVPTVRLLTPV